MRDINTRVRVSEKNGTFGIRVYAVEIYWCFNSQKNIFVDTTKTDRHTLNVIALPLAAQSVTVIRCADLLKSTKRVLRAQQNLRLRRIRQGVENEIRHA